MLFLRCHSHTFNFVPIKFFLRCFEYAILSDDLSSIVCPTCSSKFSYEGERKIGVGSPEGRFAYIWFLFVSRFWWYIIRMKQSYPVMFIIVYFQLTLFRLVLEDIVSPSQAQISYVAGCSADLVLSLYVKVVSQSRLLWCKIVIEFSYIAF